MWLADASKDPALRETVKNTLRAEAVEVQGLPHVPSADLAMLVGGMVAEVQRRCRAG